MISDLLKTHWQIVCLISTSRFGGDPECPTLTALHLLINRARVSPKAPLTLRALGDPSSAAVVIRALCNAGNDLRVVVGSRVNDGRHLVCLHGIGVEESQHTTERTRVVDGCLWIPTERRRTDRVRSYAIISITRVSFTISSV